MSIDRQKVIDTAQKFAAKGQFDKAIVEYMRIVREDPSDVRILLKIGDLQVRKGSKDDAIATYSRVAQGYEQQGYLLKAIAVYKQILSIDPNLTELYGKLAELYVRPELGLLPEALSHLEALASRYARGEQFDKLAGVFRQMVQIDPSNVLNHIKLAELLSRLGKGAEAAGEFEAGCKLLKDARRFDDWSKVAERLLFHRPNDAALAADLAEYYLERQDAKRALPKLQVCFKANARDVRTLEMLATAFRELGQLPKTISVLKEVARIQQEGGQHDKRLETYRRVLELAPNDTEAKEALRGASRVGRRPSTPPASPEAEARKPAAPAKPAVPPPTAVAGATAPADDEEEEVEEIVVVEDDEPMEEVEDAAPAPPPAVKEPTAPVPLSTRASTGFEPRPAPAPPPIAPRSAPDPAAEAARIVGEADIFLKYGLKPKALGHLQRAAELDPHSVDVQVRLRDLHAELGDAAASARASVYIATLLAESDPATALGEVSHALEVDPTNADAMELFRQLGGEVAQPPAESFDDQTQAGGEYEAQEAFPDQATTYDANAYAEAHAMLHAAQSADAGAAQAAAGAGLGRDIEEGLDEAEFFVTQGLYDEARDTLEQLLALYPDHPLVMERLEELSALMQAQAPGADDQSFALAEKLAEEVQNVEQTGGAQFNAGGEMIDVETVFAQFKKGIEQTVSADDADTHYDLGIAYKEMGLVDDAVGEFTIATKSPKRLCQAETMIGLCMMEKGDVHPAIEHFKQALVAPYRGDREEMALFFELGNAYEAVGEYTEALYFFQKVEKRDPKFRNVYQRVQRLAAHVKTGARQQLAQGAEMDEVDRAFDELLKG